MNFKRIFSVLTIAFLASFVLVACSDGLPRANPRATEQAAATNNQSNLIANDPVPRLTRSLERANLVERAEFLNNQNFQSCIYLFDYGTMVAFYPVKRKASSLQSYLLSGDQVIDDPFDGIENRQGLVVEQPDIDGAYGQNADGIFFFTLDTNEYVEWSGTFLYTSECSQVSAPTLITRNVEDEDATPAAPVATPPVVSAPENTVTE